MAAFEYSYKFSMDEEMIPPYGNYCWPHDNCIFETRIKFIVKPISGERIPLGSESYEITTSLKGDSEGYLLLHLGRRLRDCCMPNRQINTMILQLIASARQIRDSGRRSIITAAVDVEIRTAQLQGEAIAAAVDRAMKPEHLPPLHLYPMLGICHPPPPPACSRGGDIRRVKAVGTIWVEDVEEAMSVMDLCGVCGRKPIVGTQILPLLCGHRFHYHCVARRLLEETNSCPSCNHQPAINPRLSLDSSLKYDNYESDYEDDDVFGRSVLPFPTADHPFWSQSLGGNDDGDESGRPTTVAELFWSRLLDNDDADDECDRRRRLDNDDDDDDDESDDPDYDPDHDSDLDF